MVWLWAQAAEVRMVYGRGPVHRLWASIRTKTPPAPAGYEDISKSHIRTDAADSASERIGAAVSAVRSRHCTT
jgi:hypothetical protein